MNKESQKGQSTVEFALLLPLLLIITIFIIEISLVFHNYLIVTQITREYARAGALGKETQEIRDEITTSADSQLVKTYFLTGEILDEEINISPPTDAEREVGGDISVAIPYKVSIYIPVFSKKIKMMGLKMTATSTMRIEKLP
ncbi:MAG: TadE/TadG family type IV pilus assembly protein [bacterium]